MSTDLRALCAELVQLLAKYDSANPYHEHRHLIARTYAALAQPARVPVPVSERLPRPKDCDLEGKCWFLFLLSNDPTWTLEHHNAALCSGRSHWLPHWALPVPASNTKEKN